MTNLSAGGMGDKVPWFGGEMLIATNSQLQGLNVTVSTQETPSNSAFSMEAFIQLPAGFTAGGVIAGYYPNPGGTGTGGANHGHQFMWIDSQSKVEVSMDRGNSQWVQAHGSVVVNDGSLHMVDGVWDDSNLQVYVDGSSSGSC